MLKRVRVVRAKTATGTQRDRLRRVVAQAGVVKTEVDRIEPQAIDAAVEPETHVVEYGAAYCRFVEIQVGLRGKEIVQVVLLSTRLPLPRDTAKNRQPVVRRRAVGLRIRPHVPVRFRI